MTSTETGASTTTLTIRAFHKPTSGAAVYVDKKVKIVKRVYPANATLSGPVNPKEDINTYTWSTTTNGVTGKYTAQWSLTGDVTNYMGISFSDNEKCILSKIANATDSISGVITLTIIKNVDGTQVLSVSKDLQLLNPDILMTSTTNPEVMACMYAAGLAWNETYMTKEEAAAVTDSLIQTGTSNSTSIFYKYGRNIKTFDEFEYFTGLTTIPQYCLYYCSSLTSVKLPQQVTSIGRCAFASTRLVTIHIPSNVTSIGERAFEYVSTLSSIYGASGVTTVNKLSFYDCKKVSYIESTSTFGLFTHKNYRLEGHGEIQAYMYGVKTFTLYSGSYFEDMTTSRDLLLYHTGSIEDLTDQLKLGYRAIEITSNMSDAEFRIDYTSISGEEKSVVKGVGVHLLDLSVEYIAITGVTEYEGYVIPTITYYNTHSYSEYNMEYKEQVDVFIAHKNSILYTPDEWTAGGYSNDDAEGVAVIQYYSGGFIVAKEDASESGLAWGGYDKEIVGIYTFDGNSSEVVDYDGVGNTQKIIEQLSGYTDSKGITGAPAAEACANYTFPSGRKGYLPAFSEFGIVILNDSAISSAMTLIGGTVMPIRYYWTSSQYNDERAWEKRSSSDWSTYEDKYSEEYVRAFSELNYLNITANLSTKFTIEYTHGNGKPMAKEVGLGGTSLNVKAGTQVTVTPKALGNITAEPQTFTWEGFRKDLNFVFAKDAGVYIQHVNGSLHTEAEWTAGGYANGDANGVAILGSNASFVIAKEDAGSSALRWGGYNKIVPDIVTSRLSATAVLDYDGAGNTPKIIEYLAGTNDGNVDGAPVAEACAAFTFPNGKKGYLPALGEWQGAYNNKTAVVSAMTLIGGTAIQSNYYWSSTQNNRYNSWYLNWNGGYLYGNGKNGYGTYVRAFATL